MSSGKKRIYLDEGEVHEWARLVMAEIERVSRAQDDPVRLRRLRSLLEQLTG